MRIYQKPIDEHLLSDYLQTEQLDKAIELVNWYYDSSNPDGFDDPNGIKKADFLLTGIETAKTIELPIRILRSQKTYRSLLIVLGIIFGFFGFLSYKAGTINVMIIPAILIPIIPVAIYNLIKKTTEISLTDQHVEFRKSKKKPIIWNNILAIYFYHQGTGGIKFSLGQQAADFISIWKKDAVKPEVFYLNYMNREPEEIVSLINSVKIKKTKYNIGEQA